MSKFLHHEHHQLAFTFLIVLVLGGVTLKSLFDEGSVGNESVVEMASMGDRQPASVETPELKPASSIERLRAEIEVPLKCKNHQVESLTVRGEFVQIHGTSCLGLDAAVGKEIELINETNGYTASVFFYASQKYQTDLIPLSKGANKLHVKVPLKSGKNYEYSFEVLSESN